MATLNNIRKRGPLLVAVIGIALFAFIIGDFLNSGQTFLNQSREKVLVVGNEEVNIREFQAAIDQMVEVFKIETGQTEFNDNFQAQVRASVWETLLNEKILKEEAEKLGLTVTKEELSDRLIGENIDPIILQRRIFTGEDGQFSREALINFLRFLEEGASYDGGEQVAKYKSYWLYWENIVKNNILQEKYNTILSRSIVANSVDAQASFDARQKSFNFSYIAKPYFMIPDSVVTVSNKEVKDRYTKNKELYKQEESRIASYVTFDLKPQEDDYLRVQEWMDKLSQEFKTTDDVTNLINSNSDVIYNGRNYSENTVPQLLKTFAFSANKGDFFGPVFENDTHTMARLMETGIYTSDSIRLSHIFLSANDSERADSIFRVLKNNSKASFEELAMQFSAIQETAKQGGDIGWLTENVKGLDKEFLAAFEKKKNEVFVIKNAQGTQILKVTDKTPARKKVKIAILQRTVEASSRTQARIFNDAKQFANAIKNTDDLNRLAEEKGLPVLQTIALNKNTDRIADLSQSRPIVRWIFENKVGAVSDVFDCDQKFVIALVTEDNKEGYTPMEKVSSMIRAELLKEKKAEYMAAEIEKLSAKNLDELAAALSLEVKEAENVNFSSYQFGGEGFEPYVISKAVNEELYKLSAPIKGNYAVFVVQSTAVNEASDEEFDLETEINNLNQRRGAMYYSVGHLVYEDLKKTLQIQDNRSNFY